MKAVVLAAGRGKRLRPLTLTKPKCMLPVANKPLLEHLLALLHECRIHHVVLVVHRRHSVVKEYFGDGSELGVKIEYVSQLRPAGTADALRSARHALEGEGSFLLIHGDLFLRRRAIETLLSASKRQFAIGAVQVEKGAGQFGLLEIREGLVVDIREKAQVDSGLVNAGIYILGGEVFDFIEKLSVSPRGEYELTDAIKLLIESGYEVKSVGICAQDWLDVGFPWDLLEANKRALLDADLKVEGDVEEGAHLIGSVSVAEGAIVRACAYIEGPCAIAEGAEVGPNCYLRPYTSVGKHVRIGNACEIKNSIIMGGTHVAHLSYVADSIIGSNCNFGAGTIVANLRFDEKTVKVRIESKLVDTRLRKFGIVAGDNVKTGVGTLFMPGVKVGPNCWIGPNVTLYEDVPPNSRVFVKQELMREGLKTV